MRAWVMGAFLALVAVLQVVPGVGVGAASAAVNTTMCTNGYKNGSSGATCNPEEAYNAAFTYAQELIAQESRCQPGAFASVSAGSSSSGGAFGTGTAGTIVGTPRNASGCQYLGGFRERMYRQACPSGTTYNAVSHTCFSSAACKAKPALGFTKVTASGSWSKVCSAGCAYSQAESLDIQFPQEDGTVMGFTTGWKPDGTACAAGQPTPAIVATPQYCEPAPNGQTFCVKSNGDHCYSLPLASGNQVCWRPGQTGEKVSKNTLQVRNAGAEPVAATTPAPPGDSFDQANDPVTKTEKINGTTVTTTTTSYTTVNGTNAGGESAEDAGEPGDGSGSAANSGDGGNGAFPDGCDDCDNDDGSGAHAGDSIWGADETQTFEADEVGLGFGASCPAPPTVLGQAMDFAAFCTLMQAIGLIVLAAAHMHALYIIVGE